jgi:hypothetical protein
VTRRLLIVAAVVMLIGSAVPAFAQGRAIGTVKDTGGKPIKGATVRAVNPDMTPSQFTSSTDDKGRWVMLGLRVGTWTFVVEAPGFGTIQAEAPVRAGPMPQMSFVLTRDPGPIPGSLEKTVIQDVAAANGLRDRGQYEQAVNAYLQIRERNPKLTSVSLVIASVYRKQASAEPDLAAKRALLDRAIATYSQLLDDGAVGDRAGAELESTRAEVEALSR